MSEAHREADYRVTREAFRAFCEQRPDREKWELIDGEVFFFPTPTNRHQLIVGNLIHRLHIIREANRASWHVLPGIGVINPQDDHNQPEPDVMVSPTITSVTNWTSDVLVAFEVLSPFTMRRDLVQKRAFYTGLPGLLGYVVLAQDRSEATLFLRADEFAPRLVKGGDTLEIPQLGIAVAMADIYRDVPLDCG